MTDRKLTDRQHQIAELIAHGHNTESIAGQLGVTLNTVEEHKRLIYRKLGVNSMMEMVLKLYDLKEKAHDVG